LSQFLYLAFFLFFVFLIVMLRASSGDRGRRRMVAATAGYFVLIHLLLIVTQRDAWPFAGHGLFYYRGDAKRLFSNLSFVAVTRTGHEFEIDSRSWSPIHERTLQQWWFAYFGGLDGRQQAAVLDFVLRRAEAERAQRQRGENVGNRRLLGPFAAPYWYEAQQTPASSPERYERLRVYLVSRVPELKASSGRESREIVTEFGR
jgi:hypothetical protein